MSRLEPSHLSGFLTQEWRAKKESQITLYSHLGALFSEHYPNIKLAADLEKELAIRALQSSASFEETHRAIATLSRLQPFSPEHARKLMTAALENNQVYWISDDEDVHEFFARLLEGHAEVLNPDEQQGFWDAFQILGS